MKVILFRPVEYSWKACRPLCEIPYSSIFFHFGQISVRKLYQKGVQENLLIVLTFLEIYVFTLPALRKTVELYNVSFGMSEYDVHTTNILQFATFFEKFSLCSKDVQVHRYI